jgi:uncharacterized protein YbjT (DUF2867 family)
VILVKPGPLGEPADRLLAALGAHGHVVVSGAAELQAAGGGEASRADGATPLVTLAISDGPLVFDFLGFVRSLGDCRLRVLMLSRLGAHPDARTASLQRLWRLEEHVRGGGLPTLTLRFAPLVGAATPLWRKLRSRPPLPGNGRKLVNPVAERDAVETLLRALDGRAIWRGWFEVANDEAVTLAELRDLAARTPGATAGGEWEPPLDEIAEHRLAESAPWAEHFGITPTPLAAWTAQGVA